VISRSHGVGGLAPAGASPDRRYYTRFRARRRDRAPARRRARSSAGHARLEDHPARVGLGAGRPGTGSGRRALRPRRGLVASRLAAAWCRRSAPRFSPRRRRAGARTRPLEPVELGNFRRCDRGERPDRRSQRGSPATPRQTGRFPACGRRWRCGQA